MSLAVGLGHVLTGDCEKFDKLIEVTSPFLFPFVLEYSLIAMGTLAVMYSAVDEAADEHANTLRRIHNLFRVPALSASYGNHRFPHSAKCQTPLHGHRLRTCCTTPPTDELATILQLVVQQICHQRTKLCHTPTS